MSWNMSILRLLLVDIITETIAKMSVPAVKLIPVAYPAIALAPEVQSEGTF
jgi:hypothetical protein